MAASDPGKLIGVLEKEFGSIDTGFTSTVDRRVQIVRYVPSVHGPHVVCTLGLSRASSSYSFEWFMETDCYEATNQLASLLDYFVSIYLNGDLSPPKRGSFIEFDRSSKYIWNKGDFSGVYFTIPVLRTENFLSEMKALNIVPVWVIPITEKELSILTDYGWRNLEELWDEKSVRLTSPKRQE